MTKTLDIHECLAQFSAKLRAKALIEFCMLTSVIWVLTAYFILYQFNFSLLSIFGVCCAYGVFLVIFMQTKNYRKYNINNVLEHLNRQFPPLEESAQLLMLADNELTLLTQLQQKKIKFR